MRKSAEQRFWEKVDKSGDCWIWLSSISANGYGSFWFKGKSRGAHRVAYELTHGELSSDINVCHSCDNPKCVNPSHLWPGTTIDNVQDKVAKGRQQSGKTGPIGQDRPIKLDRQSVLRIREIYATGEYSQAKIARLFNVKPSTVGEVVRREIWSHI